jgi:hypothetical protein
MKKELIENILKYFVVALIVLISFKSCSTQKRINREVIPRLKDMTERVERIENETLALDEVELIIEIIGYDISYRMLYDNNLVIRSTRRPDDIMNDYTQKRKQLVKKLNTLKSGVVNAD